VNTLTDLREQVKDTLTAEGIKAVDYVQENIIPPVCVVVPANPYITLPEGNSFATNYSVGLHVLIIGGRGTNKTAATQIDSMIVNVIDALDDDWDITEVSAPQEMTLKGTSYMGAVVTLETNTDVRKEVE